MRLLVSANHWSDCAMTVPSRLDDMRSIHRSENCRRADERNYRSLMYCKVNTNQLLLSEMCHQSQALRSVHMVYLPYLLRGVPLKTSTVKFWLTENEYLNLGLSILCSTKITKVWLCRISWKFLESDRRRNQVLHRPKGHLDSTANDHCKTDKSCRSLVTSKYWYFQVVRCTSLSLGGNHDKSE